LFTSLWDVDWQKALGAGNFRWIKTAMATPPRLFPFDLPLEYPKLGPLGKPYR